MLSSARLLVSVMQVTLPAHVYLVTVAEQGRPVPCPPITSTNTTTQPSRGTAARYQHMARGAFLNGHYIPPISLTARSWASLPTRIRFFCQPSGTARLPRAQSPPYGTAVYLLAMVLPSVVFNLVVVGKSRTGAKRRATLSTHDPTHSFALSLQHAALVHLSFCICQATASSPQIRHCLTAPVSELAPITPYFQWLLLT